MRQHITIPTEDLLDTLAGDVVARHIVRLAARDTGNHPIEVQRGDAAPHAIGSPGYWTTPSGKTIVHHPNAYGWRTVYHYSSLATAVGERWLRRLIRDGVRVEVVGGVRTFVRCRSRVAHLGLTASPCWTTSGPGWLVTDATGRSYHSNRQTARDAVWYTKLMLSCQPWLSAVRTRRTQEGC